MAHWDDACSGGRRCEQKGIRRLQLSLVNGVISWHDRVTGVVGIALDTFFQVSKIPNNFQKSNFSKLHRITMLTLSISFPCSAGKAGIILNSISLSPHLPKLFPQRSHLGLKTETTVGG